MTIEAEINMKSEQEGGRHSFFTVGYCPHLVVPPSQVYLGVRVSTVLSSRVSGEISPGEVAVVAFKAMYFPGISYDELKVGEAFNILEGPQVVGTGLVLRRCL
jgi:translation elongation factor EF-Tu-like GTPase